MIEPGLLRRFSVRCPWAVVVLPCLISLIGILNLSSAAQATRPDLYLSQLSKLMFAVVLMATISVIHTRVIRRATVPIYGGAIFLLMLVLAIGTIAKGGQRWLVFGGLRIQPSDPAKFALILALAHYCATYWPSKGYNLITLLKPLNLSRPLGYLFLVVALLVFSQHSENFFFNKYLLSSYAPAIMGVLLVIGLLWLFLAVLNLRKEGFSVATIIAPIDIPVLPFLLIYLEPDLATGLTLMFIAGIMFLFIGINRSSIVIGGLCAVVLGIAGYYTVLQDYQKQRLVSFFNQEMDLQGQGYQAMQSIIAIGSGRVLGKGYSGGTQTQLSFLPENSTDFVFSVWAEEWGFIASIFLLLLYFVLIMAIFRQAQRMEDRFSQLLCVGVGAHIFVHVIINVSMVTGLMPVAGIPLPLMSYGGSSMAVTMIGIGLVVNASLWRGSN